MALTVHYSLKMNENDHDLARERIEALRRCALELPCERVDEIQHLVGDECVANVDRLHWFGQLNTDDDADCPLIVPEEIIGFSVLPGEGCESAEFGLRKCGASYGWQAFCKTAYSSGDHLDFLRCHLTVIAMLDHAHELGILHWVDDESGYWERRDWVELLVHYRGCDLMPNELGAVSDKLFQWFGPLREKAAFVMQEE